VLWNRPPGLEAWDQGRENPGSSSRDVTREPSGGGPAAAALVGRGRRSGRRELRRDRPTDAGRHDPSGNRRGPDVPRGGGGATAAGESVAVSAQRVVVDPIHLSE
jgi:hypothetical protein